MSAWGSIKHAAKSVSHFAENVGEKTLQNYKNYVLPMVPIVGQQYVNYQNYKLQQQNLNYQKQLQQTMFQRDDDAVQRRETDLLAAGMSPTLAAGSAADSGPAISTQAPQMQSASDQVLKAITMANDISSSIAQRKLLEGQVDNIPTQRKLMQAQASSNYANAKLAAQNAAKAAQDTRMKKIDADLHESTNMPSDNSAVGKYFMELFGFGGSPIVQHVSEGLKDKQKPYTQTSPRG